MLASSSARKKKLVKSAVDSLHISAADRTHNVENEMSNARDFTSSAKVQWETYTEESEANYLEDAAAVDSGKLSLYEGLKACMEKAKTGSQQWINAENSLLNLGKGNVAAVNSIIRIGRNANGLLRFKLSAVVATTFENVDTANTDLMSLIEGSLKLDHDACANMDCMLVPCRGELRELRSGHYHKIVEITENAGKNLEEEYLVDAPSCSTPRRRLINLPSITLIEELRTPAFEELIKSFRQAKSASKQVNGDIKHLSGTYESQLQAIRDARLPLTAIN